MNPRLDVGVGWNPDFLTWMGVELFAEGAMRCLFSLLFGAGMLLFLSGPKERAGRLYFKRIWWLLVFGLINAYLLLWNGDILVSYAAAGVLLYLFRKRSAKALALWSLALIVLLSAFYGLVRFGLQEAYRTSEVARQEEVPAESKAPEAGQMWLDFAADMEPNPGEMREELHQRRESYLSALKWNAKKSNEVILTILPIFLLWDALAMMLLGMALWRGGILTGDKPLPVYVGLTVSGFALGLTCNGYEIWVAIVNGFKLIDVCPVIQPTYQLGRLGMALGYLGLWMLIVRLQLLKTLTRLLADVGRMALTNYLMQSLIGALVFSGLGLGLAGRFDRHELYFLVFLIWAFQLWFSRSWLRAYRQGPLEWLWRRLTYGTAYPR